MVGVGEPHNSRRTPEADATICRRPLKSGIIAPTLSLLEAGGGTLLRSQLRNVPFTLLDSSTRSEMHVAVESMARQDRVQKLVPYNCVGEIASDCFKPS
jgi:hypothetical protein